MTRIERERLVQRYLEGEMPLAEEHDFFIQVALDKELWLDLKAHQTVESAISKDRVVEPAEIAQMGAQVTAMLAASQPAPTAGAEAGSGTAAHSPLGGGVAGMKWLAASLGMAGLVVASSVAVPFLPSPRTASPAQQTIGRSGSNSATAPAVSPTTSPVPASAANTPGAEVSPPRMPMPAVAQTDRAGSAAPANPREGAVRRDRDEGGKSRYRSSPRTPDVHASDSIPLGARFRLSPPRDR